jgi:DNA modification methylase
MRENRLNKLDAKEWLKFTKTWFIHNPPKRSKQELLHPAKFPEDMIESFISFFTKPQDVVFDPFLGTGSTLVAAHNIERNGVGIELQKKYAAIAKQRIDRLTQQKTLTSKAKTTQRIIAGNALELNKLKLPKVDFVITSPPYGPMLNKKGLAQQKRSANKLDTKYSEDTKDIGNISDYDKFVKTLATIFEKTKNILKQDKYLVIIIQNYRDGPQYRTLAWDVGKALETDFTLVGERFWLQDNKTLFPYGMGYSFVPNVHHHYCLIFKNDKN